MENPDINTKARPFSTRVSLTFFCHLVLQFGLFLLARVILSVLKTRSFQGNKPTWPVICPVVVWWK